MDDTETTRREQVAEINSQNPQDKVLSREHWEAQHGKVWDTSELSRDFEVLGFMAPYVVVKGKNTGKKGSLEFCHYPRFYFNFVED